MTPTPEAIEAALDMWSDHPYWRSRPTAKTLRLCMSRAIAAADAAWEKRGWKRVRAQRLAEKFLAWPLPESVRSDLCVTRATPYSRSGTNLLTADEAHQMIEYLLADDAAPVTRKE